MPKIQQRPKRKAVASSAIEPGLWSKFFQDLSKLLLFYFPTSKKALSKHCPYFYFVSPEHNNPELKKPNIREAVALISYYNLRVPSFSAEEEVKDILLSGHYAAKDTDSVS